MLDFQIGNRVLVLCQRTIDHRLLFVVCCLSLLFGLARFVSTSLPPNFLRVASFQIFLSAVQYRSPRVLRLCERTILLVCTTLNFVRLLFLPSHFSTPGIRHFHLSYYVFLIPPTFFRIKS